MITSFILVTSCAGDSFLSYRSELYWAGKMPELKDILQLQKNKAKAYTTFCDHILPSVVGKSVWKDMSIHQNLSQWATVTDEAFALLLLENSQSIWKETCNHVHEATTWEDKETTEDNRATSVPHEGTRETSEETTATQPKCKAKKHGKTKYTQNGAGIKKYQGWNQEGLARFNQLAVLVANNRNNDKMVFEEQYRKNRIEINNLKGRKAKTSNEQQDDSGRFEIYIDASNNDDNEVQVHPV